MKKFRKTGKKQVCRFRGFLWILCVEYILKGEKKNKASTITSFIKIVFNWFYSCCTSCCCCCCSDNEKCFELPLIIKVFIILIFRVAVIPSECCVVSCWWWRYFSFVCYFDYVMLIIIIFFVSFALYERLYQTNAGQGNRQQNED